jgi:4-amino-4-deoxy-L-arabinose transferase-like glycosyltransferase
MLARDPGPAQPRRRRRLRWRTLPPVALATAVTGLLAWNIGGFPGASDDEGTYLAQAWAVQHGLGLAHYTYWYDHPPLAWLQLAALSWLPAMFFHTGLSVAVGRLSMLPISAVCLLLVYRLARRLTLSRWGAYLAMLLYGLAPISVTMMRQIYLDEFAVMWILVAFVLARSTRRDLWHFVAAGAAAALAVLSKETMLVAVPGVVVCLWQHTRRTPVRPWAIAGFGTGLTVVGAFYPLYAVLKGELLPGPGHVSLVGAWLFQLGRPGSGSMLVPGSPSNALLQSWLYYDSVLIIGGTAAALAALAVRRLRPIAVAVVLLGVVALRPGGYLPAMYIIQLLPFLALAIAGIVDVGVSRLVRSGPGLRWLRWSAVALALVGAMLYIGPIWYSGDRQAVTVNANGPYAAAAAYLSTAVPDKAGVTVVVDDVLWLDLVRAGYQRERVLWFYKVDLDPAVSARLPDGWRDVDLIVSSPALRQAPNNLPTVRAILAHSTVVATFGAGDGRIEIRRVNKEES